jgi:predicted porin
MKAVDRNSCAMSWGRGLLLWTVGGGFALCAAPGLVLADNASDIQALKDQVRLMQQKIDQLSAAQVPRTPQTTGTVAAPAQTNQGTAATDERKRKETPALTYAGITLYGTVDIGIAYLSHGAPLSSSWGPGLPYFVQNYSNHSITSVAGNALSQSKVGLSGVEPLWGDFNGIFRLETGFNPWSGRLVDAPGSLVADNGRPASTKISSGDSSRAGQAFQGGAYAGVSSRTFGTLTFGRQNSLMLDAMAKYDPQQLSQAFAPIGLSGNAAGIGGTESARLDQSLKYVFGYGPGRFAVIHGFGSDGYVPQSSNEVDLGVDLGGFSMDALWGVVHGEVSATSLSAAQVLVEPVNSLSATVSDNTGYSLQASYNAKEYFPIKLYAGWERVKYNNPEHPLPAGSIGLGGYVLSVTTNTAYNIQRILQYSWFGARYSITPQFDLTAAYYQYNQKSNAANGCTNASAGTCAGELHDASVVADYHLTTRFDTYAGINYSLVQDGLASGFLFKNDWTPMIGVRFNF